MRLYTVQIKPLATPTTYVTDWIDITDRVNEKGISKIKRSLDSTDYSIGVYTFSDINFSVFNGDGYFSDNDSRSIFIAAGRDKALVRFNYSQYDSQGTKTDELKFEGMINEEATRNDITSEELEFTALSKTSSLRTAKVTSGSVATGSLASVSLFSILNKPEITMLLGVSQANISPDLDVTIDDGSAFDNQTVRDAVNTLLLITNSVMIIDSSDNIIIRGRDTLSRSNPLKLYGEGDIFRRENIIKIKNYNSGTHRRFTAFKINNSIYENSGFSSTYGYALKSLTIDAITNDETETEIATRLTEEFKFPKIEMEVTVPSHIAANTELLDSVQIFNPYKLRKPAEGKFYPVLGVTALGDATDPLPKIYGALKIESNLAFKIISIEDDVKKFETTLKLRQLGKDTFDGVFNVVGTNILGFAILGEAELAEDPGLGLLWNPAILGAAPINGVSKL